MMPAGMDTADQQNVNQERAEGVALVVAVVRAVGQDRNRQCHTRSGTG